MRIATLLLGLLAPLGLLGSMARPGAPPQPPAPGSEIRLIIKGDDMGAAHGIDVATIEAHRRGVLTTTNIIVPGPWFLEAARLLKETPTLDVGVHLALTSEWELVKWRPLTSVPSLVDADGYFFPMVQPRPGFPPKTSIAEHAWKIDEVERELRAQLEMAKRHLPQATYTWNHMGFTSLGREVETLVARLSKEYGLLVATDTGIQFIGRVYEGTDTGQVKADKLAAKLEALGPGLWLHIDHASTDDAEMRAIGHRGYEGVAADRNAVFQAWTSPKVREVITRRGIKLTSYRDLAKR
jgi:predicted glycoside hydrolase/deacetylase ChbG (UPF0249 family)